MAESDKKPGIFEKMIAAGNAYLDSQILKSKTQIMNSDVESDFLYSKAITEDPNYSSHSQGWKDKPYRIQNSHLKQMSVNSTPVVAIIQTRQNQVAAHSKLVKSDKERGWRVMLRDEDALLEKIKEEMQAEAEPQEQDDTQEAGAGAPPPEETFGKADVEGQPDDSSLEDAEENSSENADQSDDDVEEVNWELERKAREKLKKQFSNSQKAVEEYLKNCGKTDNREWDKSRWHFDAALRAWVRDTLTYDMVATETVPDRAGRPHHWFPTDGGTIKYASAQLKNYRDLSDNFVNADILYPENNEVAVEKQKVIDLNPQLLEKDAYKWVQVVRGKVERAYTDDELKVGIRNITTDIYANGYGVSELELLIGLITGHLNAEFYNQAYFQQGFAAKGILHVKAQIPRRKLESIRQEWNYMVKGAKNSFQTPIFAGLDDVKWIPLTQNHNDIGFEGWMRYLITMICAVYQIDPTELGVYFKSEGGSGGGLNNKSDTDTRIESSKDRGLRPMMTFLETYINEKIIKPFDSRFIMKFCGVDEESMKESLERQEKEVKFKKTVNEIRAEDGLVPLPGMDDILLDPQYMAWYTQFSKAGQDLAKKNQKAQMDAAKAMGPQAKGEDKKEEPSESDKLYQPNPEGTGALTGEAPSEELGKSQGRKVSLEVYKLEE